MSFVKRVFLALLASALLTAAVLPAQGLVIRGATVMTVANGTIENGVVVVEDGKITAVGAADTPIPDGAEIIDGSDHFLTPGIVDCHSHIAADGGLNEGTIAVSAMVRVSDVLDPDDINIYRDMAAGVTTANILHGSANPIGGQNQVIKLRWGADADGLLFEGAPPGIKFALGENVKRSNVTNSRRPPRYPATRMGVMDVIRQAFLDAQEYRKEQARFAAGEIKVEPAKNLQHEAMAEILEGTRLVHAHSYRGDEILQLLRLAEEFGFKIATFQHVLEGYKVAKELAEHGAGASTFSDWWAFKVEAYEAIPYNAALMAEKGVLVSINSDSAEEARHLNQEAAKAVKWGGMSDDEAFKLVTLNPAIQLGIDDRVGSIEVGKDADLVLYNNHPLSVYAVAQKVLIDGEVLFDMETDVANHQKMMEEKEALVEKEKKAAEERKKKRMKSGAGDEKDEKAEERKRRRRPGL